MRPLTVSMHFASVGVHCARALSHDNGCARVLLIRLSRIPFVMLRMACGTIQSAREVRAALDLVSYPVGELRQDEQRG
jgi:hypothetical protein